MKYTILVILSLVLHDSSGSLLRGMMNVSTCLPCSEEVCCTNKCSENDPYICITGDAIGGCNNSPTYWTDTDACVECCDLSDCDECEVGRIERTCGQCSLEVCATNECSDEHPYICTMGHAIGGCNNLSTYWTQTDACSECCDKTSCTGRMEPTCAKQCSNEVCDKHECSNEHPFACIKAGTENDATDPIYGCNANQTYWIENNLNCDDCCDVRLCETPRASTTSKSRAAGCGHHCRL